MTKWTDEELRALEENDDQWDWEHGELVEPAPPEKRGAVVTVRFTQAEFQQLGVAARQAGCSLINYIHDAALERSAPAQESPPAEPSHVKKVNR